MTISKVSTLVSSHWLRKQIFNVEKLSSSLRVLDTSWIPSIEGDVDGYTEFYRQGHIPSSLHFDVMEITPEIEGSKEIFPIPDSNVFQDYVQSFGISNDTHIIAYDRLNNRPSVRTWFMFRLFGHNKISILDGGLRKWVSDGYHVTVEEPEVERGTFEAVLRPELLRNYEDVLNITQTKSTQLMDARGAGTFYVKSKDAKGGHIPGSKSIPFATLFNEDGTFKSKDELHRLFEAGEIDLSKPVVSTCLAGLTACGLIAAAHIMGKENIPLYNGAFGEWRSRADPENISKIVRE